MNDYSSEYVYAVVGNAIRQATERDNYAISKFIDTIVILIHTNNMDAVLAYAQDIIEEGDRRIHEND